MLGFVTLHYWPDQASDCYISWPENSYHGPRPSLQWGPMCVFFVLLLCIYCMCVIYIAHLDSPPTLCFHQSEQRISAVCLVRFMPVYDDDLLISDGQQRVIDRLVPPSPLLSISAHSSLSTYRQRHLQAALLPEIPVNNIK